MSQYRQLQDDFSLLRRSEKYRPSPHPFPGCSSVTDVNPRQPSALSFHHPIAPASIASYRPFQLRSAIWRSIIPAQPPSLAAARSLAFRCVTSLHHWVTPWVERWVLAVDLSSTLLVSPRGFVSHFVLCGATCCTPRPRRGLRCHQRL